VERGFKIRLLASYKRILEKVKMRKFVSLLVALAVFMACFSALSIGLSAEGTQAVGKRVTFGDSTKANPIQMFPVIYGNAGITSLSNGTYTVSYTVYNENSFDISVSLRYQHSWKDIDGCLTSKTVAANSSAVISFTYTYSNGKIGVMDITPTNLMLRFDVYKRSGSTNEHMPENSTFVFAYNKTDGTDAAEKISASGVNKTELIYSLPQVTALGKKLTFGDISKTTATQTFPVIRGSLGLSSLTEGTTVYSYKIYNENSFPIKVYLYAQNVWGELGLAHGSVIVPSGTYKTLSYSLVVSNGKINGNTVSASSLTLRMDTYKYVDSTQSDMPENATMTFAYNKTDGTDPAVNLSISNGVNTMKEIKELPNLEAADSTATPTSTPTQSPDIPTTTEVYGVRYKALVSGTNVWVISKTGVFKTTDVVNGKLTFEAMIFNEFDEDISIKPAIEALVNVSGTNRWEGKTGSMIAVEAGGYGFISVTMDVNNDNTVTISGQNVGVSELFLRFNIYSDVNANGSFVVTANNDNIQRIQKSSSSISFTSEAVYDVKYNYANYADEFNDDEPTTDLRISSALGNYMVLQRDKEICIWGTSSKVGYTVSVEFKGKTTTATVQSDKTWKMYLPQEAADKNESTLTASCDGESIKLKGILIGDVFFVGGQSNAEKTLGGCGSIYSSAYKKELVASGENMIRLFQQGRGDTTTDENYSRMLSPQTEVIKGKKWAKETVIGANAFSAMGIFFGHKMYEATDVPIGLVMVASSGSPLSQLMSAEASQKANYTRFENNIPVSGMYNSLMHPFINMTFKSMIFYQGESEMGLSISNYGKYNEYLNIYVEDLREKMNYDFPFYFVQMSSHAGNGLTSWPYQGTQRACQFDGIYAVKNSGMVVSMDMGYIDGQNDWAHPDRKKPIGDRLADLVLCREYGIGNEENVTSPFPTVAYRTNEGIVIRFTHVAGGLKRCGSYATLKGFKLVCGTNKVDAVAEIINSNEVLLRYNGATGVTGVAYGIETLAFTDYDDATYIANLGNGADLPAPSFILSTILDEAPQEDKHLGDVDNDGKVDESDVEKLTNYLAGWKDAEKLVDLSRADIDSDGRVTARDRAILARYVANWGSEYGKYFE